ncbi:MAG TPA: hypothetical protein VFQ39_04850, partial [Longimicrobium sp.]|nr:hypothetical protein [Longimicrobium sp.]
MHPYLRTLLPLVALLTLAPLSPAHAQETRPRKRIALVYRGMSAREAVAALGRPVEVRREGGATYLYYAGQAGDDVVVIRDCRVESARFRHPDRFFQ